MRTTHKMKKRPTTGPQSTSRARRRRRLGQHFLTDRPTVARLLRCFGPRETDLILEIGPGQGSLTLPLAGRVRKLLAVEVDHHLASDLLERLAGTTGFRLLEQDFMTLDLDDAAEWLLAPGPPGRRVRILGNLPYALATAILSRLLPRHDLVSDLTVMVQEEVALRILACPGQPSYGAFSVRVKLQAQVERLLDVPPGCFSPPPAVQSTVLGLHLLNRSARPPHHRILNAIALAEQAFLHRRKTALNSLYLAGLEPTVVRAAFRARGLDPAVRAQQLTPNDFLHLAEGLPGVGGDPS